MTSVFLLNKAEIKEDSTNLSCNEKRTLSPKTDPKSLYFNVKRDNGL